LTKGRHDEDEHAREFGRRVRALRELLGVSQEELGERAELHRTYVGRLERGELNPSLHNILRVAHGLGVDPMVLVRGLRLLSLHGPRQEQHGGQGRQLRQDAPP
jgi:transcriptional regulator with XRE-family HTH domain